MQSKIKTLFLIPSTLGDSDITKVIPDYNLHIIQNLGHFAVEEEKSARRYLIRCGHKNISSIEYYILNEHTPLSDIPGIIMKSGDNDIGLISEAGLPAVADPGALLVREAHRMNLKVVPLSGPSSLMLALMASGMNGQNFAFNGYLPVKPGERIARIRHYEKQSESEKQSQIFIEAPYRNNQLTESFLSVLKPSTHLCIAVNLTLPEERVMSMTIGEWKKLSRPDFHKQPAVFVIQAG